MAIRYRSQYWQDRWLIEIVFKGKTRGLFVDVGANDGVWISNTYCLEKNFMWDGILIEADKRCFENLRRHRAAKHVLACLDSNEREIEYFLPDALRGRAGILANDTDAHPEKIAAREAEGFSYEIDKMRTTTLNKILDELKFPPRIDYLSMDIEGAEYRAALGLDLQKYRFSALTIERPKRELNKLLLDAEYIKLGQLGQDTLYVDGSIDDLEVIMTETQYLCEKHKSSVMDPG